MKISASILAAPLALILVTATTARAQAPLHKDAVLPAHPATLLSLLPKPPPGWEVTTSRGETLVLSWVITDAERTLQKVQFAEGEDPNRPPVTRIRIRDTGNFPGYLAPFANFEPNEESTPRRLLLGSFPTFVSPSGSSGLNVKLLAGKRFVIEMTLENQPDTNISLWLKAFDFQALSRIDNTPLSSKPSQAEIVSIDELEPDNNNAYVATISRGSMVKQAELSDEDRADLEASKEEARQIAAEMAAAAAEAESKDPADKKNGEKNSGADDSDGFE